MEDILEALLEQSRPVLDAPGEHAAMDEVKRRRVRPVRFDVINLKGHILRQAMGREHVRRGKGADNVQKLARHKKTKKGKTYNLGWIGLKSFPITWEKKWSQ
jgi:hypothetical protein